MDESEQQKFEAAARQHGLWIRMLQRDPKQWTVGRAMRECGFTETESKNASLQQRVHRLEKSLEGSNQSSMSSTGCYRGETPSVVTNDPPVSVVHAGINTPVSAITGPSPSSASTLSSQNDSFLGGCRRTQKQVHAARIKEHKRLTTQQELHKRCTKEIAEAVAHQKLKAGHKKGVKVLLNEFSSRNGVPLVDLPAARTIQQIIKDGRAGLTPPRRGPKGTISESDLTKLGTAVKCFVALSACNGDEKSFNDLKKIVNTIANSKEGKEFPDRSGYALINRIFKEFGIDLEASKLTQAEARRVLWTTKANLENMFNAWKDLLIKLNFAHEPTDDDESLAVELTFENIAAGHELFLTGELVFSLNQLRRIINIDETCLSLDGLNGKRGGRPSIAFLDPTLPRTGKAASKCGYAATMVIGGSAAGETTPPHFQFPSTAQEHNQRIQFSTIQDSRDIMGQFGHEVAKRLSPSFGMNEKGGMDEAHFEKYLIDLIYALYPDVADLDGKRVLVKADQGPGRSNIKLLARLRARGIYLFPSVPNSSSVTQEMDQIFGLFKHLLRLNLDVLHSALMKAGRAVSLGRDDCCMLVFGGRCTLSDGTVVELEEAFDKSFCARRILHGFASVGAAPLTRKCLSNEKVRIEIDAVAREDESPTEQRIRLLEEQLRACVSYLALNGFMKADLLLVQAKRKIRDRKVTVAHTIERQLAYLGANTIGGKYIALEGNHLTHDDLFLAEEIRKRRDDVKVLEAEKKSRQAAETRQQQALNLIEQKEAAGFPVDRINIDQKKWLVSEVELLLKWKLGRVPPDASNKAAKLAEWQRVKSSPASPFSPWTDDDEAKLQKLKETLTIEDTELGKERRRLKQDAVSSLGIMSSYELDAMKEKLDEAIAAKSASETANTVDILLDEESEAEDNDCSDEVEEEEADDDRNELSDDSSTDESLSEDDQITFISQHGNRRAQLKSASSSDEESSNDGDSPETTVALAARSRRGRIPKARTRLIES